MRGISRRAALAFVFLMGMVPVLRADTPPPAKASHVESQSGQALRYRIDESRSNVSFSMKATLHTVEGKSSAVSGEFSQPSSPSPGEFPVTGRISIAARTLDTGNGSRDKRMRSESLAMDRYPQIVFEPSRAVGNVASFAPGSSADFKLEGDLTVRGVRKRVVLDVTAKFGDKGVIADGKTTLSFPDFGVPDPSNFLLHVSAQVAVSFHLEARAVP